MDIDIAESAITEFDITDTDIRESDITKFDIHTLWYITATL